MSSRKGDTYGLLRDTAGIEVPASLSAVPSGTYGAKFVRMPVRTSVAFAWLGGCFKATLPR